MRWLFAPLVAGLLLFGLSPTWAATPSCQNRAFVAKMMHEPPPPYPVTMKIMISEQAQNFLKFGPPDPPASLTDPKAHLIAEAWLFKEKNGYVTVVFYLDGCTVGHVSVSLQAFLNAINGISSEEPGA